MLFFPSHDIALAHGVKHFNPPLAALRLQEDLASLSDVWNGPYLRGEVAFPQPWGWDWDTRKFIHEHYKIKKSQLPTDEELETLRRLSSRQTTVSLIEQLGKRLKDDSFPTSSYLSNMAEVETFISSHKDYVLKTPWSSSGRGLMRSTVPVETLRKHAQATLQKMGGIMGEPWIEDKVQDFAMLFFVGTDKVRFIGYSLFDNDATTYRQGYLMSNAKIVSRLQVGQDRLKAIRDAYLDILQDLFAPLMGKPWQVGYIGIDMMIYRAPRQQENDTEEPLRISPCVEMNLRCTMGVVCRLWYDEHQQEGIFRISPMEKDGHFKAQFLAYPE